MAQTAGQGYHVYKDNWTSTVSEEFISAAESAPMNTTGTLLKKWTLSFSLKECGLHQLGLGMLGASFACVPEASTYI